MKTKKNNKGITMLELMITVVIFGITTTLAFPQFERTMDKLRLKSAGRDIVSSLRLARSDAVSQRQQFGVYFDLNSGQCILFKDLANLTAFTYDAGSDSDLVTTTLPSHVNFGSISFPSSVVIFKPDGSASNSGSIGLYSYEGYYGSFTVDVLSSTGRVKLIFGT
jgi:prepilin-type N-terminal cleavage/methylation domain-containing protein